MILRIVNNISSKLSDYEPKNEICHFAKIIALKYAMRRHIESVQKRQTSPVSILSIHIHKRECPEISKFYKSRFEGCGPPRKANKGSKDRSFYVDCP